MIHAARVQPHRTQGADEAEEKVGPRVGDRHPPCIHKTCWHIRCRAPHCHNASDTAPWGRNRSPQPRTCASNGRVSSLCANCAAGTSTTKCVDANANVSGTRPHRGRRKLYILDGGRVPSTCAASGRGIPHRWRRTEDTWRGRGWPKPTRIPSRNATRNRPQQNNKLSFPRLSFPRLGFFEGRSPNQKCPTSGQTCCGDASY